MVIRIELSIFDQIVTSVSFDINKQESPSPKCWHFKDNCQTAPLAKLKPEGSYLFMKYDVLGYNADFFIRNGAADQL